MTHRYYFSTLLIMMFATTVSQCQDWQNLAKYQSANAALEMGVDDRIVFMGNSITEGWVTQRPKFFTDNPFVGRGISGQTTPQMLLRFRQDVIALKPKAVVILAGINDIAGNTGPSSLEMIIDNLTSMVDLAHANNIQVILSLLVPANRFGWQPKEKPAQKVIELNKMIQQLAKEKNVITVDYYSHMVDDEAGLIKALGEDGVHPNEDGYAIMERLVLEAISKLK